MDLTLPVTRMGVGPFSFDPLEAIMGVRLADLLEPLMTAPVERRPSASGTAVEVFPLALPDGEGATIPLGALGELGFRNDRGLLALTVPWAMSSWVTQRLGDAVVRGPEPAVALEGGARIAHLWLRLRPGLRASFPLAALGELAIESR